MKDNRKNIVFRLLFLVLLSVGAGLNASDQTLFREDFEDLDEWEPLFFREIDRHTSYAVEKQEGSNVLVARSDNSASAIIFKKTFNVAEFPIIRWSWKVDKVYTKGDYSLKSGDDYPIRVYVLFAFEPENASLGTKIKYKLARALYGRYPPDSIINYIWTNQPDEHDPIKSPFTDRSIMIPLQYGPKNVGRWVNETVNVLEDFRLFFGGDPPRRATLAIMNDSDNTGENSTSFIRFIEVLKTEAPL